MSTPSTHRYKNYCIPSEMISHGVCLNRVEELTPSLQLAEVRDGLLFVGITADH
jgi:hypothetical protein